MAAPGGERGRGGADGGGGDGQTSASLSTVDVRDLPSDGAVAGSARRARKRERKAARKAAKKAKKRERRARRRAKEDRGACGGAQVARAGASALGAALTDARRRAARVRAGSSPRAFEPVRASRRWLKLVPIDRHSRLVPQRKLRRGTPRRAAADAAQPARRREGA
eukprot:gene8087-1280_t